MNIGEAVKHIKKQYPSISISRVRFLEREGLINPKRSKGGTRYFTPKDIDRIIKILSLQEDKFYSLKAIKNNKQLISSTVNKNIKIQEYSKHDVLKKSGLTNENFNDLIEYNYEKEKKSYDQNDLDRLSAFAYFFNIGLTAKNFSIIKSSSERGLGFFDMIKTTHEINEDDMEIAVKYFSIIVGSYILKDS